MLLEPITKTVWASLSDKQRWDVQSSLRGPDIAVGSDPIKYFSTSVIRGKMRNAIRVGGLVNQDLNLVIIPNGYRLDQGDKPTKKFTFSGNHFFHHVAEAAAILGIPTIWLPSDEYTKALLACGENVGYFGHALYTSLTKQVEDKSTFLLSRKTYEAAQKELARHLKDQFGLNNLSPEQPVEEEAF